MKKLYILLITLFITSLSFGQEILTDSFSYPDGSLVPNGGWANHSGAAGNLLVVSGQVKVEHGIPDEDANIAFTSVSGSVYFGIDFSVADLGHPYSGGTDFEYFAHFQVSGSNFVARLDIVAPSGSGDFSVGIATTSSTADATWASDLTFGTTYRAIVKYDQDNNIAQLWIDASTSTDTSILGVDGTDPGVSVNQFALRQSDSSENETIYVDNLKISNSFDDAVLSTTKSQIAGFSMYPNPVVNGRFSITSNSNAPKQVNIYSMIGQQVYSKVVQSKEPIEVSNLNKGVYMISVFEDGKTATRKLVIN